MMLTTLALLAEEDHEHIRLVTGIPVSDFQRVKEKYRQALLGTHSIRLLQTDGNWGVDYSVTINEVKIIPQPVGTLFWAVLGDDGSLINKACAAGKMAVLDIGQHTVDLTRTNTLEFVDRESTSFNDIGLFTAYQDLSYELNSKLGIQIPPEEMEQYVRSGAVKIGGHMHSIHAEKDAVFQSAADKILSRAKNTWVNMWELDKVLITGGGAMVLGEYLCRAFNNGEICPDATFTNCLGYYRYGRRVWPR